MRRPRVFGMRLDPATLMFVAFLMSVVVGALQFFSWLQDRRIGALRWWSASSLINGIGVLLVIMGSSEMRSWGRELGNAAIVLGIAVSYAAARRFNRNPVFWPLLLAAPGIWFISVWTFDLMFAGRIVLNALLFGTLLLATARELWSGPDRLASQRAAAVMSLITGVYMLSRILIGPGFLPSTDWMRGTSPAWMAVSGLIVLLYVMVFGFLSVSMAKEKVDLDHRRAALLDPLTGVANRRSFMQDAERCIAEGGAAALVMFDLDHFKTVNDTYGHAAGDRTLIEFCAIAAARLPADALFCRMGGEEFAALLPGATRAGGAHVAEHIRKDLLRAGGALGWPANITVSAGVAVMEGGCCSLPDLLAAADAALYRAKAAGRNRVVSDRRGGDSALQPGPRKAPAAA